MADPFIGEIRMFGGNFAPVGWALCQGQILAISQNEALFALIGTTYGGDGQQTFALPNLQSRVPIHQGAGFALGQAGGAESVTLTTNQIPGHSHTPQANSQTGSSNSPAGSVYAAAPSGVNWYSTAAPSVAMSPSMVGAAGGSQPHDNMIPYLAINFIIALEGIFPSQN